VFKLPFVFAIRALFPNAVFTLPVFIANALDPNAVMDAFELLLALMAYLLNTTVDTLMTLMFPLIDVKILEFKLEILARSIVAKKDTNILGFKADVFRVLIFAK
jgi:hypothetical protein